LGLVAAVLSLLANWLGLFKAIYSR
jgi:hypothetical protein